MDAELAVEFLAGMY